MSAIKTQGFKLEISNADSPETFTQVLGIKNFSGFDGSASTIDVTTLQSTSKEFLMGLQDNGSLKLTCNHLPSDAGQTKMRTAKGSGDITGFKVTLSDETVYTFDGFVLSNPLSGGVDAAVEGTFEIKISGDVTEA